ncbi:hypothetical protein DFR70_118127 [Nocardia tenerifensis]|uniref:Secreted protein n=1 Tax=Nocardia tenerifensis TaxID=228006 RepID=A0A318JVQ0_9NOCA|nr:hypothetical protein [Nocardia tenerifensis]PXX57472.1 hypothetical protein DFR70_118127 [Nocardia tenerifensis]
MSSGVLIIVIILVVLAAVVVALLVWPMVRRQRLRNRFGPEYDRTVREHDDRRAAERELAERERRHAELELRALTPEQKQLYTAQWVEVQERFIDDPAEALQSADRLLTTVMAQRGYPTENFDQQVADLSVEHAETLGHYRAAHEIATRATSSEVSTEDRRAAVVHYRELFQDLLNGAGGDKADDKTPETDHKAEHDTNAQHDKKALS